MDKTTFAYLLLRIVYAWMFLFPLKNLLYDWQGSKDLVGLLCPYAQTFSAILMIIVMTTGSLSILVGFYGQLGGAMLFAYCLLGAIVHYRLAKQALPLTLNQNASCEDKNILAQAKTLATVGNITSAQKNFVLAAVGLYFMLIGTGPISMTKNLF